MSLFFLFNPNYWVTLNIRELTGTSNQLGGATAKLSQRQAPLPVPTRQASAGFSAFFLDLKSSVWSDITLNLQESSIMAVTDEKKAILEVGAW